MKNAFNEDLPYITHFVSLHPFLRRSHIFLTFTRYLTLINSNLIKPKKQPSLSNKVQTIPYFQCIWQIAICIRIICSFFTVITLNIFVCSYCCKLFVIKYFLLTSSSDKYSAFSDVPCADATCIGYFLVYAAIKKRKNQISDHS